MALVEADGSNIALDNMETGCFMIPLNEFSKRVLQQPPTETRRDMGRPDVRLDRLVGRDYAL